MAAAEGATPDAGQLRVLIVEDLPSDAELMVLRLEEEGFAPDWRRVQEEADFRAALAAAPDIILSDWKLPRFRAACGRSSSRARPVRRRRS